MLIKEGTKSEEVRAIQEFLINKDFLPQGAADGIFGKNTAAAVRHFQARFGLRADAIVGAQTLAVMKAEGLKMPEAGKEQANRMQISQKGIEFIHSFEQLRLTVYDDGYGFPTVGYGHLVQPEDKLKLGDRITREQAEEFFRRDLKRFEDCVNEKVKVRLTQNQYDALVSLAYNIGAGNFSKSTLLKFVNQNRFEAAAYRFEDWVKSAGKVSRGLQRRRRAEREIFES